MSSVSEVTPVASEDEKEPATSGQGVGVEVFSHMIDKADIDKIIALQTESYYSMAHLYVV